MCSQHHAKLSELIQYIKALYTLGVVSDFSGVPTKIFRKELIFPRCINPGFDKLFDVPPQQQTMASFLNYQEDTRYVYPIYASTFANFMFAAGANSDPQQQQQQQRQRQQQQQQQQQQGKVFDCLMSPLVAASCPHSPVIFPSLHSPQPQIKMEMTSGLCSLCSP